MRNARARVGVGLLGALAAAGCGSARAEVEVPRPRASLSAGPRAFTTAERAPEIEQAATVTGDVRFLSPPGDLDLGRVVVFLEERREGARTPPRAAARGTFIRIASGARSFAPPLVAVPWNRSVVLANDGSVNHRLFATDLGAERAFDLPPETSSDPFRLPPVGPIRFFCSLHSDETFVVFSEKTAHVAVVEAGERFSFGPVAPGRYMLSIWSERVEGPVREVLVDGYSRRTERVWIDPRLVRRADAVAGKSR